MYPRILGVYSRRKAVSLGTSGRSLARHDQLTYWYVRRLDDERYELTPLNRQHVPSGVVAHVEYGDFFKSYFPEPMYYKKYTVPAMRTLAAKIKRGETHFEAGEYDQAEREFLKAVMVDEINARANLGLGSVYCEKGDFQKVRRVLDILLGNDATFREEQRHQFNTFGISLRKQRLFAEAIVYYQTALKTNKDDEHLHFNIARAFHEAGDCDTAGLHLDQALGLRPDFPEAQKFKTFLCKLADGESGDSVFIDGPEIVIGV